MIFLHPFPDVQSRVKLIGLTSMLGNYFRSAIWLWLLSKWRLNLAMQETKSLVNYKPRVKFIGFQTTEHYFYRWCSFYFRFSSVSIQYEVPRCGSTAVSSFPCHECLYRDPSDLWRRLSCHRPKHGAHAWSQVAHYRGTQGKFAYWTAAAREMLEANDVAT